MGGLPDIELDPADGFDRLAITPLLRGVLRTDVRQPGFALLRLPPETSSNTLRRTMVEVRNAIHELEPTRYFWLHRFDHRVSSRPHQDGAPGPSVLVLGYETSRRRYDVRVIDLARLAHDRAETAPATLAFLQGIERDEADGLFVPYTTSLGWLEPEAGPWVLILNNSGDAESGALGVMHGAEIPDTSGSGLRVVDSMMLLLGPGEPALDEAEEEARFLERSCLDG